jgi:hypothetical protein
VPELPRRGEAEVGAKGAGHAGPCGRQWRPGLSRGRP